MEKKRFPKEQGKRHQVERRDRQSATGMNGEPKKGGRGGKFTWSGNQGRYESEYPVPAVDAKDPNFEDPRDDEVEIAAS